MDPFDGMLDDLDARQRDAPDLDARDWCFGSIEEAEQHGDVCDLSLDD